MPTTSNIPPRAEYQKVFTANGIWVRPSGVDVVWVARPRRWRRWWRRRVIH